METHEHLKFCIERFDHYYDSVNNKSALFLAVNTFIVGGLMAIYPSIQTAFDCGFWINGNFTAIVFSGLISILFTLSAGIPFLAKPSKSHLYFESIARFSLADFKASVSALNAQELQNDYTEQIHQLSIGLRNKFIRLRWAGYLIFLEFILSIPFIIILMNNIKSI